MNKILKNITLAAITFIFFSAIVVAQDCDECQFTIDENFFNSSIVGYYLGGFNPSTGDTDVLLFEYIISGPSQCYHGSNTEVINVEFSIDIFSPALGFTTPTEFLDATLVLSDFTGPVRIKNTDINVGTSTVDGADLQINQPQVHVTNAELESMASYIINTGKIPNGTYVFSFTLTSGSNESDCSGQAIDQFVRTVEIYEPTFLDLISPGERNIASAEQSPVFSTFPVFNWSTDMCSACNYGIRVSEYDPSKHSSLSEALNDNSSLPLDQSKDFFTITGEGLNFQYPSSGGIELFPGNYYVWQIRRDYGTTVGQKEDYSEIFIFKINSFDDSSSSNLDIIKDLLGDDMFESLFGPGKEFDGYSLSGFQLNGAEVDGSAIQNIINSINQGNSQLIDINVE